MNIRVGQRVKLIGYPGKEPDKYNPKDMEGVVISVTGDMNPVIVAWDNGIRNSYIEKYLELV